MRPSTDVPSGSIQWASELIYPVRTEIQLMVSSFGGIMGSVECVASSHQTFLREKNNDAQS